MNEHAGYAAAVTIRLALLQELAAAAYAGGVLPNSVVDRGPLSQIPGTYGVDVHVDSPMVAINTDRSLILRLRGWGKLGMALGDATLTLQEMLIENEVTLVPEFGVPNPAVSAGVDHPTLLLSSNPFGIKTTLTSLDGSVIDGGLLRQGVQQVTADSLNAVFGGGVLDRLTNTLPIAGIATDQRATGDCVVVPEGIVIGISLPGTSGDRSALRAFGSTSLAYAVNPDFVVSGLSEFVDRMRDRFAALADPATVGPLSLMPIDGALAVRTKFRSERASLRLRFSIIPTLHRAPPSHLSFSVVDVEHGGSANSVGDAIVLFFTETGDNEPDYEVVLNEEFAAQTIVTESSFVLPKTTTPKLTGALRSFTPTVDGLVVDVAVSSALPPSAVVIGPTNGRVGERSTYRLVLPIGHMAEDPRLDLVWSLDNQLETLEVSDSSAANTSVAADFRGLDLVAIANAGFRTLGSGSRFTGELTGGFTDISEHPTEVFEPTTGRDLSFTTDFSSGPLALIGTVIVRARATRTFGTDTEVAFAASLVVRVS